MSLADALERRTKPRRGCGWAALIASMPEEDAEVAAQAMNAGGSLASLIEAIRDEGYSIGDTPAYKHRRGECACP